MSRSGTIMQMMCPECGRVGMRFVAGDGALGRWKDWIAELSAVTVASSNASDELEHQVRLRNETAKANQAYREAWSPPQDVPDDANVVYCPSGLECGYVTFTDRIQWEEIDKRGVVFDD